MNRWSELVPFLDLDDDTLTLLQEAIQAHQPFRLDVLTLLQGLTKDARIQAYLQRDRPADPPVHDRTSFSTDVGTPESHKLMSVKGDPALRDARYWNLGLKVLLPAAVWDRLQTAFRDGRMRQDDYRFLRSVLALRENPVPPRHRNTAEFLKWLALRLAQDGHVVEATACLDANRKHQMLKRVATKVQQYQQGQLVHERPLLAAALGEPGVAVPAPVAGRTADPRRGTPHLAPPPPQRAQAEPPAPRTEPLPTQDVALPERPSQWSLDAALPLVKRAWMQGLSDMMPLHQRVEIRRAIHQDTVKLTAEQVKLLQTALHVYYDTLPQGSAGQGGSRSPIRYTAALDHLFGALDLPFLQRALANQRMNWAAISFPDGYERYQDTGSVTHRLVDIWLALM
ncbi:hypothetical protein [Deinococcus soli (ex Cha et al. 2016)]|uniref:hypothetical protein n=1 Tax=Deinococcus soli (ex Cha et al. 2016) TaxID=1309411 RepID=UPI001669A1D9|nr:hypothetical protein [Deinococcus soli (ex Cha et al. 2016)]